VIEARRQIDHDEADDLAGVLFGTAG